MASDSGIGCAGPLNAAETPAVFVSFFKVFFGFNLGFLTPFNPLKILPLVTLCSLRPLGMEAILIHSS
jgi:hypothetical protein